MPKKSSNQDAPVTIKKYANRRLYNTSTSSYVTLDHLCGMVRDGIDFVVYGAKSGEDITHSVLTQIIMEEETKGHNLLPIKFLRQLITFYGDSLSSFVPRYLELSMDTFARNQEQMRTRLDDALGGFLPLKQIEEMGKSNMAMFQSAMEMFAPREAENRNVGEGPTADRESELAELKLKFDAMQRQLDEIAKRGSGEDGPK